LPSRGRPEDDRGGRKDHAGCSTKVSCGASSLPRVSRLNSSARTRLHPHEFIRRFLIHVLPKGFHRIRHYGLFANANRAENIATARALLNVAPPAADPQQPPDIATETPRVLPCPCPRCGGRMIVIETFAPGCEPSWRPMPSRIDTS
jgi:hypothetical protein